MKIIIPGGSGHLGTILRRDFERDGHEVVVLRRGQGWEVDGADVVINLAGRSVNCRYNSRNRAEILNSRVDSTRIIGEAIARAAR
ncbi:MAG TPA: epimerase, partial [Thermoanaerobaculia bacterium]|nr:epimerase [Thermoanaerobaculia bacterium]